MLCTLRVVHGRGRIVCVVQQDTASTRACATTACSGPTWTVCGTQPALGASRLEQDLERLQPWDLTEKGINLSSSQRQQVSVARALRAEADLVLPDNQPWKPTWASTSSPRAAHHHFPKHRRVSWSDL